MLGLQIDDKDLDLGDDFSFTMNLKNPMFNELGGYTYPFKIPNTPKNSSILGFRHRVQSTINVYGSNPGMFLWNGHPLFCGKLQMKILNNKSLEGSLIESNSDFYFQAKNLNLEQIDFGEDIFATEVDAMWFLTYSRDHLYPEYKFACPTLQNDLWFDPPTTDPDLQYYNDYHGGGRLWTLTTGGHRTLIMPMLYLRYVFAKIASQLGFELIDELFTSHPDLAKLVLYNSVSCNFSAYPTLDIKHLQYNYHVPRLLLMDFITAIEKYFCAVTLIDGIKHKMRILPIKKIILDHTYIDFSRNILSISTELEEQINGFNLKMDLDGDDPKLIIKDLEEDLAKIDKGSVKTKYDLPPWPMAQILDQYYVENENRFYEMYIDKTWIVVISPNIMTSQFYFRDPKEAIESKLSTLYYNAMCPTLEPPHLGSITCGNKRDDWANIVPRILFALKTNAYAGMGTFTNAANETDNFSLFFPGEKGLYNTFWKEYLKFKISTKLVKIEKLMDFTELQSFDFSRKYMINGIKYLVKDIQVVLKKNTILPAILSCYPCP